MAENCWLLTADAAIKNESDIVSDSLLVETYPRRHLVADTDIGKELRESISELENLLMAYREGVLNESGMN